MNKNTKSVLHESASYSISKTKTQQVGEIDFQNDNISYNSNTISNPSGSKNLILPVGAVQSDEDGH